jgi:raffinose/stachyose/melibiose transport system permease protein
MTIVALIPFVSLVLVSFYPPGQLTSTGLDLPDHWSLDNYIRAWEMGNFAGTLANSAIIAFFVVLVGSFLCILSGYAFGAMRFAGSGLLFTIILLGLLLPFEAIIVPLYYDLRAIGLTDTYQGLILPEIALFSGFGTFWMRQHFRSVPKSLVEAARMDGANTWQTLWKVLIPNAGPSITTMMVMFFIWSWNQLLLALVINQNPQYRTAPFSVGFFIGQYATDSSALAAAAVMLTIPALIVYILLQRHFIQGITSGSVKD